MPVSTRKSLPLMLALVLFGASVTTNVSAQARDTSDETFVHAFDQSDQSRVADGYAQDDGELPVTQGDTISLPPVRSTEAESTEPLRDGAIFDVFERSPVSFGLSLGLRMGAGDIDSGSESVPWSTFAIGGNANVDYRLLSGSDGELFIGYRFSFYTGVYHFANLDIASGTSHSASFGFNLRSLLRAEIGAGLAMLHEQIDGESVTLYGASVHIEARWQFQHGLFLAVPVDVNIYPENLAGETAYAATVGLQVGWNSRQ